MKIVRNTLFYGDNLNILRDYIEDNSIDLIYLDPPFNSKATYNILFKEPTGEPSQSQITAFEDTWHWTEEAQRTFEEIVKNAPSKVVEMITALRGFIGCNDMMAYLTMITIRLIELNKVLKNTGSIYLHCDPNASHFLKLVMDTIFGVRSFKNEIIWHYRKWPSGFKQFQRNHDIILFYSKSESKSRTFNIDYMERTESTLKRFGKYKIVSGYDEKGKRLPSQTEKEESKGVPRDDVWDIRRVPPIKQLFPTQKPEALLERIIKASSNEGDFVLDPFCGCGTTVAIAEKLKRKWVGIDITHLAINLIKGRMKDSFGLEAKKDYTVVGEPKDLAGARELFSQNAYQFQWWALSLIDAKPYKDKKKGADTGIDGYIYYQGEKTVKKAIVQVKGGHVSVSQIRDLIGVMDREKVDIVIFITLRPPTRDMKTEAISKGFHEIPLKFRGNEILEKERYAKVQIITIEELFKGVKPNLPFKIPFSKRAERYKEEEKTLGLFNNTD